MSSYVHAKSVQCAVRKDENAPRQVRSERLRAVITVEDRWPPGQKIGVFAAKIVPGARRPPLHPLMDEDHIRPGDRLVIEHGLAVMRRESFQPFAEALQGLEGRDVAQIRPGNLDVFAMTECPVRQRAALEAVDQLALGHPRSASVCESALVRSRL